MLRRAFILALMFILIALDGAAATLEDASRAVKRDDWRAATQIWRELADAGDPLAQFNLGVTYLQGEHILQDYEQAYAWLRKAAGQGQIGAQYHLGHMFEHGLGVPRDLVSSHMWYNLSVAHFDNTFAKNGVEDRDRVAALMTPAQIREAQRLAREWRPDK